MPATHQTPPSTAASPPRKLSTGQRLPQVARSESPTRSASWPAPGPAVLHVPDHDRRQPEPDAQRRHHPESRPQQQAPVPRAEQQEQPDRCREGQDRVFRQDAQAPITPARIQRRRSSDRIARSVHTAAQVQQQTSGVSEVMITPPIAKMGIAGRSRAANIPVRRDPVVSSARRKMPQAVRPPRSTAGSRAANISEPVSRRLSAAERLGAPAGSARRSAGLGRNNSSPAAATTPSIQPRRRRSPSRSRRARTGAGGHHRQDHADRPPGVRINAGLAVLDRSAVPTRRPQPGRRLGLFDEL